VIAPHSEGPVSATVGAVNTALTAGTSIGATSLPVTAATGTNFAAGQMLLVDSGASADIVKVASVTANAIALTDGGCASAHLSGAGVTQLGVTGPGASPLSPYLTGS
jgi:hypothetical protein